LRTDFASQADFAGAGIEAWAAHPSCASHRIPQSERLDGHVEEGSSRLQVSNNPKTIVLDVVQPSAAGGKLIGFWLEGTAR
jgi:hypothetical protein